MTKKKTEQEKADAKFLKDLEKEKKALREKRVRRTSL